MKYSFTNSSNKDMSEIEGFISDFYPYAQERLNIDQPVSITLKSDSANAMEILGKTGYYDPDNNEIVVYIDNRHPKDILRSISHELVHHAQNCRGEFDDSQKTTPGYAQADDHMRKMESEAYLLSNGDDLMIFRDFEDQTKKENCTVNEQIEKQLRKKISGLIAEVQTEKDLRKKISGLIAEVLLENKQRERARPIKEEISDKEWYHGTLYESLLKKWAK